jgi:nitrate/nitrite transporter NarK
VNYAQQYVREDLGLSHREFGWCMSAFFFSYALAQVPSGWLTDRFGARLMLTWYIIAWSFFTAALGWVTGLVMLLVVRLAAGLAQAGAYPTAASVVGRWVPLSRRGLASSIIGMGGRVGAAAAPILTAYLIILFVPAGTLVTISEGDVYDVPALAVQLAEGAGPLPSDGDPPPENVVVRHRMRQRLWGGLDQPTRERLTELAAIEPAPATIADARQLREKLARLFNQAIEDPRFTADMPLRALEPEREALRLLDSEQPLSEPQQHRLQRLVLEKVLPDGFLKLYVRGWRPAMFVYGLAGIFVAVGYYWIVRDRPQQHPRVTAAELAMIQDGRPAELPPGTPPSVVGAPPMGAIVLSPSLWLLSIAQFGTNIGWVFLVTWLPRYLFEVQHASFEDRGIMASVPNMVGWIGMIFGGWWTDRLTIRLGRRFGRAFPMSVSRFVAMTAFLLVMFEPSPWVATGLFAMVAFGTDLGSPSVWAYNQDVGGRYVASVLGWGNMWGNLGAAVSPVLLEEIVRLSGGSWNAAFLTCAAAFLIAGVCAAFVNADKRIDQA